MIPYELFNLFETEGPIKMTCFREIFRAASADSLFASAGHFCNMSHVGNHVGSHVGSHVGNHVGGHVGGLAGGGCPRQLFWCPCFRNASALRRKRRAGILKFSAMRRKSFAHDPCCDPCYVLPRNLPRGFRGLAICFRATPHVHSC